MFLAGQCMAAVGQSLCIDDLAALYQKNSPEAVADYLQKRGWEPNASTVRPELMELSWQRNNVEDILIRQDSTGMRTISYRLKQEAEVEGYRRNVKNFKKFDPMVSNSANVELYRKRNALQQLTMNRTRGILTVLYAERDDVSYWTRLAEEMSKVNIYTVGAYLPGEGGVVIGKSPDGGEVYIVAMEDLKRGNGCSWSSHSDEVRGCFLSQKWNEAHTDYSGARNSAAVCQFVDGKNERQERAVQLARSYRGAGKDDWYIPSIAQLKMIADSKVDIDAALRANGGVSIAKMWYWSSSQYSGKMVWAMNFKDLLIGQSAKDGHDRARAVRTVKLK